MVRPRAHAGAREGGPGGLGAVVLRRRHVVQRHLEGVPIGAGRAQPPRGGGARRPVMIATPHSLI
eukprot:6689670-Pyramimonas_sp.AAC.1